MSRVGMCRAGHTLAGTVVIPAARRAVDGLCTVLACAVCAGGQVRGHELACELVPRRARSQAISLGTM